ncbi:aminotransferase class I/II-fold pyridoxal phosphate-dependent enzyme [Burkholderia sp. GS2Y]|uniref:Aminotransferase n=1 Tax=Burkholderia theae TaxID=3143496 RepID=A0ABU9WEX9_9BURK
MDSSVYLSASIRAQLEAQRGAGDDVIDFTIGNPDFPPPPEIVDHLARSIADPGNHRYAAHESAGERDYREAVAGMYRRRFDVTLDATRNTLALLGCKESAHYLCMALVEPGDVVMICEPAYTTYRGNAALFGAEIHAIQCRPEHGYLPDWSEVPASVLRRTKILFLNYPNNPTGAVMPLDAFEKAVALAHEYGFVICNDSAYAELYYDAPPPSVLSVPGALEVAVEVGSLSKSFNLCGWRLGYMVGHPGVVERVLRLKQFTDAGPFPALQQAGAAALRLSDTFHRDLRARYRVRRDRVVDGLRACGYDVFPPPAGMFVWARTPDAERSDEHVARLLREHRIACNPGGVYGLSGTSFVRFALSVNEALIEEAMYRLGKSF